MTNEPQVPKERSIVETDSSDEAIVEKETSPITSETMALIEAIRTKASSETKKAGEFTREKYLETVRSLRTEIEKLEFKPEEVEQSFQHIQEEAEKNWESITRG